jgi:hypothetical protein
VEIEVSSGDGGALGRLVGTLYWVDEGDLEDAAFALLQGTSNFKAAWEGG